MYSILFVVCVGLFWIMHLFGVSIFKGIIIAFVVFFVSCFLLRFLVISGGDKATPGSRIITQEELQKSAGGE
jgi:hypothetical protein